MNEKKQKEYLETMELVRDLYFHTGMNVSQVARLCRISPAKASNMIDGKFPKSIKRKENHHVSGNNP